MSMGCFEVRILKQFKIPAFIIIVLYAIYNNVLKFSIYDLEVQRKRESERVFPLLV